MDRRGIFPDAWITRAASTTIAALHALSSTPVPRSHDPRCAPSTTNSSGFSRPRISPTTFSDSSEPPAVNFSVCTSSTPARRSASTAQATARFGSVEPVSRPTMDSVRARKFSPSGEAPRALCIIKGARSAQDFPTEHAPVPCGTWPNEEGGLIGLACPEAEKPNRSGPAERRAKLRTDRSVRNPDRTPDAGPILETLLNMAPPRSSVRPDYSEKQPKRHDRVTPAQRRRETMPCGDLWKNRFPAENPQDRKFLHRIQSRLQFLSFVCGSIGAP